MSKPAYQLEIESEFDLFASANDAIYAPNIENLFVIGHHYNTQGQLSQIDDQIRGRVQYHYDALDRLVQVDGPSPERFVHDPAGNILAMDTPEQRQQPAEVKGNRVSFQGDSHYRYDARGNRSLKSRGKDHQLRTYYRYNALNQLEEVRDDKQRIYYVYDPLGRRIAKSSDKGVTNFLWMDDVLMYEGTRKNNVRVSERLYLFEPGTFKPLAFVENREVYHYHLDHLGTPQEITDAKGNIVWAVSFKAYGNLAVAYENQIENNLRFQGQYFDEETGLHYNRFRYYDPGCGRFINQDPIGLAGGNNNYLYVPNPTGWVDPFGLSSKEIGDVCPKGPATNRAEFNEKYASNYNTKTESDAAWKVYQESSQSQQELVIGRLPDTEVGESLGMRRLNNPDWTPNVNDAWVQGGIDGSKTFYLGSEINAKNLRTQAYPHHPDYPMTVTHRELTQLRAAGYSRQGNYLVPPQ